MGEFGREHADAGIARRASLVATSVGVDILDANDAKIAVIGLDKFDFAGVFAGKTVMERSGGRKDGGFVFDNTHGTTVANEDFFKFQGFGGNGFRRSSARIVGQAKSDFAVLQSLEKIERFLLEFDGKFEATAQKIDIRHEICGKSGKFGRNLLNIRK